MEEAAAQPAVRGLGRWAEHRERQARTHAQDCEGGAVQDDAEVRRLLDVCGGPGIEVVSTEDLSRIPDGS
jgi:hypothetical protein